MDKGTNAMLRMSMLGAILGKKPEELDGLFGMLAGKGLSPEELGIKAVPKTVREIVFEAKLAGRTAEVEELRKCIEAFHSEVAEQANKLELANETINKLRAREDKQNDEIQRLTIDNDDLAGRMEKIQKAVENLARKSATRKEIILHFTNARKMALREIANLPKRPTRKDLQDALLVVQKILNKSIDGDAASKTAEKIAGP